MKEEKDILNRDVEIPEVVFRKADAALNQIRANTGSTKATRKVTRIQGRIHHVQAAAVACAVLIGAGGSQRRQQSFTICGAAVCRQIFRQQKNSRKI